MPVSHDCSNIRLQPQQRRRAGECSGRRWRDRL